ncbi:protein-disulfide isomerase, related to DsbA [Staphylococcus schleiferi]|uniref:DsbA family protein n=1 Tax=Staphylococcus coagulans TaxID=74706 RepID=UPI0006BD5B8A|nr:thioredoxin domain-containing protein [Staphylococcus coagulans]MDR9833027.1 thioredoxin domain-containing protein [Staphylococcus coagulans]BAS44968.1 protein-disulfide isomerase, related to DsbA [Staphylococcus schleiferi]
MKKIFYFLMMALVLVAFTACQKGEHREKQVKIVEYFDYKCPYCKVFDQKVMTEIEKKYGTERIDYQLIDVAFLGNDAIEGARAAKAVQIVAPQQFMTFHHHLIEQQPNHEGKWLTHDKIDQQINRLSISKKQKDKIKNEYKSKNSEAWKRAEKDIIKANNEKIKLVPTLKINGEEVSDPLNKDEVFKKIDDALKA